MKGLVWMLAACAASSPGCRRSAAPGDADPAGTARIEDSPRFQAERERMVTRTIEERGVRDGRVLAAMRKVPRHEFVPEALAQLAYADRPLPIGEEQTISQPYIVALMTELARVDPGDRVLEVGTGSGYQAAVLAELAGEVFSVEIVAPLAERAQATLARLGYGNVQTRIGDGYGGWPEEAPFDAIVVTAAPPQAPEPLKEQLAVGGRLVIPVGEGYQELVVYERTADGLRQESSIPVMFVPMTGKAQGSSAR